MIETLPLFINDKLIFGSWDNYLYCIDSNSGSLIWKWTENKNFYYSTAACIPATDGKHVFVTSPDKFVSSIDLLLGTTVWRKDLSTWESIGISSDRNQLLIKNFENNFTIASSKDGEIIKQVNLNYKVDTMPVIPIEWNSNIIFGAKDGNVYMIDNQFGYKPLLFTGTARVHSVQHIKNNIFAASNMDGKIFVFKIL
jgi:outer membrane protein assembly factor BamB